MGLQWSMRKMVSRNCVPKSNRVSVCYNFPKHAPHFWSLLLPSWTPLSYRTQVYHPCKVNSQRKCAQIKFRTFLQLKVCFFNAIKTATGTIDVRKSVNAKIKLSRFPAPNIPSWISLQSFYTVSPLSEDVLHQVVSAFYDYLSELLKIEEAFLKFCCMA